jgi:hypothetical protein
VPPENGCLTLKTCRGLRHKKVIVKVKVYEVGYVIVIAHESLILCLRLNGMLHGHVRSVQMVMLCTLSVT